MAAMIKVSEDEDESSPPLDASPCAGVAGQPSGQMPSTAMETSQLPAWMHGVHSNWETAGVGGRVSGLVGGRVGGRAGGGVEVGVGASVEQVVTSLQVPGGTTRHGIASMNWHKSDGDWDGACTGNRHPCHRDWGAWRKGQRHRTFVAGEPFDDKSVRPGHKHPRDQRLKAARVVDVGELGAGGLEVVAAVQPEPSVVRRSLAGRERVLPGGRDSEPVVVLAGAGANVVGSTGGVAGDGAPAGEVTGRRVRCPGTSGRKSVCA